MTTIQTTDLRNTIIRSIDWAPLRGERPRAAGSNARLGRHGSRVAVPIARITTADGIAGFGRARITPDQAKELVGSPLARTLTRRNRVQARCRYLEYPLWDLLGQIAQRPVYALCSSEAGPLAVTCYDTSLYMDDLYLPDDARAAALIAGEALQGAQRGHRHFKIKVGRGAMHMPPEAGARRDVAVIRAVRQAVGPDARIMIDANNGYNLNMVKRVLGETADSNLYWIEEPFHEDGTLYGHLKEWIARRGLAVRIADGEGAASPRLLEWAQGGLVDVVQNDVFGTGFTRWLALGRQLDGWGVRAAPHHYGEPYGNYVACHLAGALPNLDGIEWDEASVPGLDGSAYAIVEGRVHVPPLPGFGLALDEHVFARAVGESGFAVHL